jgi:multisubunit Na+/H+ antiporter MnhC subunit
MAALIRKFGLFYLTATGTFFLLCAYGLAARAPNFPYLPAVFLPVYLAGAVAMSERETADPMLDILPVAPGLIVKAKFWLGLGFVALALLHMTLFTAMQGLGEELTWRVMKLNVLSALATLVLAAGFQAGFHFFGQASFHKVVIGFCVAGGVFCLAFFIAVAESGRGHPDLFPLAPTLDLLPMAGVLAAVPVGLALFYQIWKRGPWHPARAVV